MRSRSAPLTCPEIASNDLAAVSTSPAPLAAARRMRSISCASPALLPPTASASRTLASASLKRCALISSCAACSGLPTSGRTACACAAAGTPSAAPSTMAAAIRVNPCRIAPLLDELLVAHHPELGHAQALRAGQHRGHRLVLNELVRADVHLRLVWNGRRLCQLVFQRRPIGQRLAVPQHRAVEVDVDGHHHRLLGRRR